jgi:hypothetical protein
MRKTVIVYCSVLLTGTAASRICMATTETEAVSMAAAVTEDLRSRWRHDIVVTGTLQNRAGAPLQGVKCTIEVMKPDSWQGSVSTEKKIFDNTYIIEVKGGMGLDIMFIKPGYAMRKLSLDLVNLGNEGTTISGRQTIERDMVFDTSSGDPYSIETFGLRETNPSTLQVFSLSPIFNREIVRSVKITTDIETLKHPVKAADLGVEGPLLSLDREKLTSAPVLTGRPDSDEIIERVFLYLGDCDSSSGLRRHESAPATPKEYEWPLEMQTAPEDGYTSRIQILADDLRRKFRPVYFYIRVNGYYGKGQLGFFEYSPNDRLDMEGKIFFQLDGTTNTTTRLD